MTRLVDPNQLPERRRVSPIDAEIAKLDKKYYKLSQVAEKVGVADSTIRRLVRREVLPIPSKVLVMGELRTYLFTEEDVESIKQYYKSFSSN